MSWGWIEAVQQPALVARLRDGTLSIREQRGLGLPWSPELVERARRTTAGTVAAVRRALRRGVGMNLGGGTHHAGYDFARGYCLFNDVAVALAPGRRPRASVRPGHRRHAHQGDGPRRPWRPTARPSPCRCTARATTPSSASRRPRRRPPHRDRRRRVPARARWGRRRRDGLVRGPCSSSISPAPTPSRATACARPAPTKARLRARDEGRRARAPRARPSSSSSPAATRTTSRTRSTSTGHRGGELAVADG